MKGIDALGSIVASKHVHDTIQRGRGMQGSGRRRDSSDASSSTDIDPAVAATMGAGIAFFHVSFGYRARIAWTAAGKNIDRRLLLLLLFRRRRDLLASSSLGFHSITGSNLRPKRRRRTTLSTVRPT